MRNRSFCIEYHAHTVSQRYWQTNLFVPTIFALSLEYSSHRVAFSCSYLINYYNGTVSMYCWFLVAIKSTKATLYFGGAILAFQIIQQCFSAGLSAQPNVPFLEKRPTWISWPHHVHTYCQSTPTLSVLPNHSIKMLELPIWCWASKWSQGVVL
jgi:hypothetical protein